MKAKKLGALLLSAVLTVTTMTSTASAAQAKTGETLRKPDDYYDMRSHYEDERNIHIPNYYGFVQFKNDKGEDIAFETKADYKTLGWDSSIKVIGAVVAYKTRHTIL